MLLGEPAPTLILLAAISADFLVRRRAGGAFHGSVEFASLGRATLVVATVLMLLGLRNHQITGSFLQSPAQAYAEAATTAPDWFWQKTRPPQEQLDPVLERYDELVAIPMARWETPVYRVWMERLIAGANQAGGIALAFFALVSVLILPAGETRPAWLVASGSCVLALLRHDVPPTWWAMLTPALVTLTAFGAARLASSPALTRRVVAAGAILHLVVLGTAPQARSADAEYLFDKRITEVTKKLKEQPGLHLVFVGIGNASDGRIEPANLPRDWSNDTVLFARDLGDEKNAELVAAMPGYKPSEIKVLPGGIGLKPWKSSAASSSSTKTEEPK